MTNLTFKNIGENTGFLSNVWAADITSNTTIEIAKNLNGFWSIKIIVKSGEKLHFESSCLSERSEFLKSSKRRLIEAINNHKNFIINRLNS